MIPTDISEKYAHQLYFFSKEAEDIRLYFGGLLYNTNTTNDHQIKNLYNFDELSQKVAVLTNHSDCYKIINSMLKTENSLKIIIALLFKGFSWTNEMINHFNISRKLYVVNTLHSLQKLNLIVKEKGERLNPYYFDALEMSKSLQVRKALHQTDMYYLTSDFIKFCSLLKDLFEYKIRESESFRFSLKEIVSDAKKFQYFYELVMDEELNQSEREHKTEDGIIYYTDTIKAKKLNREIKEAVAELKLETLKFKEKNHQLTNQERQQLSLVQSAKSALVLLDNENDLSKNIKAMRRGRAFYQGKEINLAKFEEEQRLYDEKLDKSPAIIGNKELEKETPVTLSGIKIKGYYLSSEEIKKHLESQSVRSEDDKALDFLNSLGGVSNG